MSLWAYGQSQREIRPKADAAPAAPSQTPTDTAAPAAPTSAPPNPELPVVSSVLATVNVLSDEDAAEYIACDSVIAMGWGNFVQVGLAFARIREKRLYRMEYLTFEAYCRQKWQYGRNYVNRLISAAQVFNFLVTACHQIKPEHEAQVRPLMGLSPAEAQAAWELAVTHAGGRKVSSTHVKQAIRELRGNTDNEPAPPKARQNRTEQRRQIDETLGQLLMLLSQKAGHDVITAKVEALHGQIQALIG
jgi:hypothetical protein